MLLLPTFNASLTPCPVGPSAFSAHEKRHFCGSCQRVVQDFSQSTNPVADLAAAHAAAPDGRVCGMFRRAQTTALPPLTRRLRWFLMALVLVLGQGLTAREALAQVRQPAQMRPASVLRADTTLLTLPEDKVYGAVMEVMPVFQNGGSNREVIDYIQKRIAWPRGKNGKIVAAEGRLFVAFTVGVDGQVRDAKVIKTFSHRFDEAALVVVRCLPPFMPGLQNGLPVPVSLTLPITFKLK